MMRLQADLTRYGFPAFAGPTGSRCQEAKNKNAEQAPAKAMNEWIAVGNGYHSKFLLVERCKL